MLTLADFFLYFGIIWSTNIALNVLGTAKMYYPSVSRGDYPLDFGAMLGRDRLIGNSITLIGLLIVVVISLFVYVFTQQIEIVVIPLLVYLGGAVGSFIKRRMHKTESSFVPLVDHGDYVVVTGMVLLLFGYASLDLVLVTAAITYALHPLACYVAYKLKLRVSPH